MKCRGEEKKRKIWKVSAVTFWTCQELKHTADVFSLSLACLIEKLAWSELKIVDNSAHSFNSAMGAGMGGGMSTGEY
jgi:hypothetical protein